MNTFGNKFRVSIFGESHGEAIGVVLDGVPAGLPLTQEDFVADIDRRRSGARGTTPRREADLPVILSGVCDGHTTGAPLAVIFRNENTRSADYDLLRKLPRPGHADRVAQVKWGGYNDARGGGHFSGRITLPLVAAGVVAKKVLATASVGAGVVASSDAPAATFASAPVPAARIIEIGGLPIAASASAAPSGAVAPAASALAGQLDLPPEVSALLDQAIKDGDSLGGVVECVTENLPIGLGEPFFNSAESLISHAIFAIPGARGIEFGDGFAASRMRGSEHNDPFGPDGKPIRNGAGGINGGITNGAPLVFRVAFKPTSSISRPQTTLNFETGKLEELSVPGRHDICFALRTPVIVEAVTAIVLADLL